MIDELWTNPPRRYLTESDSRVMVLRVKSDVSPTAIPTITNVSVKLFKNGADVSSTFLTGSPSISGNVITYPRLYNLANHPGVYVMRLKATFDSVLVSVRKTEIHVFKDGDATIRPEGWADEERWYGAEGDEPLFEAVMHGVSKLDSGSAKIFRAGKDVSATCLTGSASVIDNIVLMPTVHNLTGNAIYVLVAVGAVGSVRIAKKILLHVQKESDEAQ